MPSDWAKAYDEGTLVVFEDPGLQVSVWIFSQFAEYGWVEGVNVDGSAESDLSLRDGEPGFRIISLSTVSPTTKRSHYRYNGSGEFCDITGYGLHILLTRRHFFVRIEVCDNTAWKYTDAFVERVFDSFTYSDR